MTPRGYIFAAGHWDYALECRGVLFAPVYFPVGVYGRTDYTYTPSIVLNIGLLPFSLFACPLYNHYYFGDYYDDAYLNIGIFPWFGTHRSHAWYDPDYEHARWNHHRSEPRWEEHGREEYNRRRADTNLRPARTYREQESRVAMLPEAQRHTAQVTQPLTTVVARQESSMKFERISTEKRQEIKKQATAVHTFGNERTHWEQQKSANSTREREAIVAPPVAEHRESVQQPRERNVTVAPSVEQREANVSPPRESRMRQSERVQIPVPPIVGESGRSAGIYQKEPPAQPNNEGRNNDTHDYHRGKGSYR
jgi:hypothetical protein